MDPNTLLPPTACHFRKLADTGKNPRLSREMFPSLPSSVAQKEYELLDILHLAETIVNEEVDRQEACNGEAKPENNHDGTGMAPQ
ncbi:hypothetical protein IV203_019060 [Nitzschia inconspicua]|uniref:Uncharacterized protein n=1 Tax=Nitzschia inconspicua TaxID=303405 RepID=A0A9K3LXU7_9STRA|nr:hypothetical protein IV203_019060 [Nitzschia inconspicua]